MRRTTILADGELLVEAKHLARMEGRPFTALVHDALTEYIQRHRPRRKLSFVGIGRSGYADTSERHHEILAQAVDPITGWSPDRGPGRSAEQVAQDDPSGR